MVVELIALQLVEQPIIGCCESVGSLGLASSTSLSVRRLSVDLRLDNSSLASMQ